MDKFIQKRLEDKRKVKLGDKFIVRSLNYLYQKGRKNNEYI